MKLVLTCEHAFPDIPEKYKDLFSSDPDVLSTHEAYDPGSFDLFQFLKPLSDFNHYQEIGRLLIESNRSLKHQKLFSRFSAGLDASEKQEILNTYYLPYRLKVENNIQNLIEKGDEVLHISVHSFTPELYGEIRNADLGILFDPSKNREKMISRLWKETLNRNKIRFKVRLNYPYLGKADGFTTSLRKMFPENYSGIELEVNQKWANNGIMDDNLKNILYSSLEEVKSKA